MLASDNQQQISAFNSFFQFTRSGFGHNKSYINLCARTGAGRGQKKEPTYRFAPAEGVDIFDENERVPSEITHERLVQVRQVQLFPPPAAFHRPWKLDCPADLRAQKLLGASAEPSPLLEVEQQDEPRLDADPEPWGGLEPTQDGACQLDGRGMAAPSSFLCVYSVEFVD